MLKCKHCKKALPKERTKFCSSTCKDRFRGNVASRDEEVIDKNIKRFNRLHKRKLRRCLGYQCNKMFPSSNPGNRFCPTCEANLPKQHAYRVTGDPFIGRN